MHPAAAGHFGHQPVLLAILKNVSKVENQVGHYWKVLS
jgi:hypothetical protein